MLFLGCDKLKLKNEKSLLDFIEEKIKQNTEYFVLLKFVRNEFLDEANSNKLNSIVNSHSPEKISILKKPSEEELAKRYLTVDCKYDGTNKFNGILKHLIDASAENIISNGTIEITASSYSIKDKNSIACILQEDGDFTTIDKKNGFILFDFKDKSVNLTGYSMKSTSVKGGYCFLKNWVLVSNDQTNWTLLDERNEDKTLDGYFNEGLFEIKENKGNFRYVRLTQIGQNWSIILV